MKARLLLIEDESIFRMDMRDMLEDEGYEIIGEAGDGEKGIELAFKHKPDLIIMDIKMPKLDGLRASQIICRSLPTPILLLTAYSQREYVEKAKQSNIVGYLVKPITEASFVPAVEIALAQAKRLRQKDIQAEELRNVIQSRKEIERAKGILMQEKQLSEDEAYKWMRRRSMELNVSMEQLAQHILKQENKRVLLK